jgi:hypothetical protein
MLLSLPKPAAASKRVQKKLVDALVERRKLEPFLQICERFIAGYGFDEVLQRARGSCEIGGAAP